ncbi:MAG: DUF1614 domain-containing protein [Candidatus Binataceae bacterium]
MLLAPFLLIYALLFFLVLAFLFALIEIGIINYAFQRIGLSPELAFFALLASLAGSYVNIPLRRIEGGAMHPAELVSNFGIRYRVPMPVASGSTVLAVNVGGAMVPFLLSTYVLVLEPAAIASVIVCTAIVTLVVNRFARPIPGLGIATPMLIPPITAAIAAYALGGENRAAVAYVSGVMGTLIGADLMNLRRLRDLGAPVASIGGAGTFDGIFLTGIVAVLLV